MSEEIKFIGDWRDSLIKCPSQLSRFFKHRNICYCLIVRWRTEDPWQVFILKGEDMVLIGEGKSENDPVSEIHSWAEELLRRHLEQQ